MQKDAMQFVVRPTSGTPIYRQLMEQVLGLIAGGRLQEGEMLPSVRQLAADLEVNMMTISKAYSRLEADGVLERVRGSGMRVRAPKANGSVPQRLAEIEPLIEELAARAFQLQLPAKVVVDKVQAKLQANHHSNKE